MEPDLSDLSREEHKQRVAELETEKEALQQQRDKVLAKRSSSSEHVKR